MKYIPRPVINAKVSRAIIESNMQLNLSPGIIWSTDSATISNNNMAHSLIEKRQSLPKSLRILMGNIRRREKQ